MGMTETSDDIARLRREFEELPKVRGHGESVILRHSNIRPEWVIRIIGDPFDRYEERDPAGERQTIIVGRVPESNQWIKLVFIGDPETGILLTAYNDRRLEGKYGGRPWHVH